MPAILLVPVIFTACCWLLSLRRTPFALGWLVVSAGVAGIGVLITASADSVHHTIPGLVAASLASCVIPGVLTAVVEECADYSPGTAASDIAKWRHDRRRRSPHDQWVLVTRAEKLDSGEHTVWVGVRTNQQTRWIGHADPLVDMDAFMELRVKADQAAETLNALKIG